MLKRPFRDFISTYMTPKTDHHHVCLQGFESHPNLRVSFDKICQYSLDWSRPLCKYPRADHVTSVTNKQIRDMPLQLCCKTLNVAHLVACCSMLRIGCVGRWWWTRWCKPSRPSSTCCSCASSSGSSSPSWECSCSLESTSRLVTVNPRKKTLEKN